MDLDVKLFAVLRDKAGTASLRVSLPDPTGTAAVRAADVLAAVGRACPALAPHLEHCRLAVDLEFAGPDTPVPPGAEVAIIPPVSGG